MASNTKKTKKPSSKIACPPDHDIRPLNTAEQGLIEDPGEPRVDEAMMERARKANSDTTGGHVDDLIDDNTRRIRRWPCSRYCGDGHAFPSSSRPIKVSVTSYEGIAPGATHYRLTVEEYANPIWDDANGTWRKAWDDQEAIDIASVNAYLRSKDAAMALVVEAVIAIAGKEAAVRPLLWCFGEDAPSDITDKLKSEVARRWPQK